MKYLHMAFVFWTASWASAQSEPPANIPAPYQQVAGYEKSASEALILEVNLYAKSLELPEAFPITGGSLTENRVTQERIANRTGGLGNLHTTNYAYAFGRGRHLTSITRLSKDKSQRPLRERFERWKIDPSAVNTNAALTIALRYLTNGFIDVPKLTTSATSISVHPIAIQDMTTSVYSVEWQRDGKTLVEVGLDEPTRELWLLRVNDVNLITRSPLQVKNSGVFPPVIWEFGYAKNRPAGR